MVIISSRRWAVALVIHGNWVEVPARFNTCYLWSTASSTTFPTPAVTDLAQTNSTSTTRPTTSTTSTIVTSASSTNNETAVMNTTVTTAQLSVSNVTEASPSSTLAPPAPIDVKLVGLSEGHRGRLEVHYEGEWGTVCDDLWSEANARVICRQLNYRFVARGKDNCNLYGNLAFLIPCWPLVFCSSYSLVWN